MQENQVKVKRSLKNLVSKRKRKLAKTRLFEAISSWESWRVWDVLPCHFTFLQCWEQHHNLFCSLEKHLAVKSKGE